MKTKEQYFKEARERREAKHKAWEEEFTNEIMEEIKEWDSDKLEEEYIKCRLARVSYSGSFSAGLLWDWSKEECRFCGLEYIQGHETCCDNCWDKNKDKTLEELDND